MQNQPITLRSNIPAIIEHPAREKSKQQDAGPRQSDSANKLKSFRDRIVKLEEEKKELSECIKEVYEQAQGEGYNKDALKLVVKEKLKPADRTILEETNFYLETLGEMPLLAFAERNMH